MAEVTVIVGLPPVYGQIVAAVGVPPDTAVYTYGDTVYSPSGGDLDADIEAHERKHMAQQAQMGAEDWWDHWTDNVEFRVWQELEGYQAQYRSFCKRYKDRNDRARYAFALAKDLAGPMYGRVIEFEEAYRRIRE
jgi:hypothetical protein